MKLLNVYFDIVEAILGVGVEPNKKKIRKDPYKTSLLFYISYQQLLFAFILFRLFLSREKFTKYLPIYVDGTLCTLCE